MSEDEIEKEAERRLKAEKNSSHDEGDAGREADRRIKSERPAPKPTPKPNRGDWESRNPGEDYDEAMKARDANPIGEVGGDSDYAETQQRLRDAEQAAQERRAAESSGIGILDSAKTAYEYVPDDLKPAAKAGAGMLAGKALRAALPQEQVFGTPEYLKKQDAYKALVESHDPTYRAAMADEKMLAGSEEQHREQAKALMQQRAQAMAQYQAHLDELNRAQLSQTYFQSLNPDDELNRRLGLQPTTVAPPQLTPQPRGGEGSQAYALKFGAGEAEAREVPSMSAMQKQNIPANQQAWQKIANIAPGFESVKESPLLLGVEGQKVAQERLAKEQQQANQAAEQKKAMQEQIARQKAEAQLRLETAQENARLSAKAVAAADDAYRKLASTSPIKPADQAKHESSRNALADLQEKIIEGRQHPLAKLGTKVAGRFIPGAGAAFAPLEAEAAKKAWEEKNYGRAAAHGLGTVGALAQATGVPLLMGAGDIMQIPAAGLSLYDLLNEPTKP